MMPSINLKKVIWFTWKPNMDLLAIIVTWFLVVGFLSLATYIATPQRGGLYFIFYALLGAAISGVTLPVIWSIFIRHRSLADLGVTLHNLPLLLTLQVLLSVLLYSSVLFTNIPPVTTLFPLISLALSIGFFEALYWRGFVLSRLEEMFGIIPSLVLGSFLYAVYHIGYGMPSSEMFFLFFIGLMFAILFRLTKSIFVLWPFYQPLGQLVTLIKDGIGSSLPLISILGFIEVLAVMLVVVFLSPSLARKLNSKKTLPVISS